MLVLTRKPGERIELFPRNGRIAAAMVAAGVIEPSQQAAVAEFLAERITAAVEPVEIRGRSVRLGFTNADAFSIRREELRDAG